MTDSTGISITLPDGSARGFDPGSTGVDLVSGLGHKLRKRAVALVVDGQPQDLASELVDGSSVRVLTFDDPEGRDVYWHSGAHLLAQAVLRLYPGVQLGIGPTIDEGFYYDILMDEPLTADDLPRIEEEMRKIVAEDHSVERRQRSRSESLDFFESIGQGLKTEIIEDIVEGDHPTSYVQGEFEDLCRGPHVPSTGRLKNVKLLTVSGAYWRGDEDRPMLQRIYGTAYEKKADLEAYLLRLEEARKRDHRKLGRELDLVSFHPLAPASPIFLPRGARVYNLLIDYVRELYDRHGYQEVITPQIYDRSLFETSGHLPNYGENMFFGVTLDGVDKAAAETEGTIRERMEKALRYGVKSMNCPGHAALFSMTRRSYRELPLRIADFGRLHRYERSGTLHGLTRVRSFAQDDAHIFCTMDQVQSEISVFIDLVFDAYQVFGFDDARLVIATRPPKRLGSDEVWDRSEHALQAAVEARGMEFEIAKGEGAFYGPKIEFHVTDAIGRPWQLATIQVDFNLPERFELTYVDNTSTAQRPVMLHRALLGSLERFMGVFIEHVGGAFPTWLAPEQIAVLPITDAAMDHAESVRAAAVAAGLRCVLDGRNEKIGAKIREAERMKIPFMFVIGEREAAAGAVAIRRRGRRDEGTRSVDDALRWVADQNESRDWDVPS